MRKIDQLAEAAARAISARTSRRSLIANLGVALVGAAAFPLLPVARGAPTADGGANPVDPNSGQLPPLMSGNPQDPGDQTSCDYWRYCAIDGSLCTCCGGKIDVCPPGTEMSPITWIGTCLNPADNRHYIISYNDCCGGASCSRCGCHKDEGDRPIVRPSLNNEITWCFGTQSQAYSCSTAVILGTSMAKK